MEGYHKDEGHQQNETKCTYGSSYVPWQNIWNLEVEAEVGVGELFRISSAIDLCGIWMDYLNHLVSDFCEIC